VTDSGKLDRVPEVSLRVLDALEAAGLRAAMGGGLALNVWVVPRVTKDVDLNVFVGEEQHSELLGVLEEFGCLASRDGAPWNEEARATFLRQAREGEVAVAWSGEIRIDVFVPSIPFYEEAEKTLRAVAFPDGKQRLVLSPESLAVFKLLFFRDRDLVDLRRLVAARRDTLDTAWVRNQLTGMLGADNERVAAWDEIVALHGAA